MSGDSGVELGGPYLGKEYNEDDICSRCYHQRKSHTSSGCTICNCSSFSN